MTERGKGKANSISDAIVQLIDSGDIGVLITIIDGSESVGEKILLTANGTVTGGFSDNELTPSAIRFANTFLASNHKTHTFRVAEFAPDLIKLAGVQLLFERIESEPRLIICGAGHVGASLARFAHQTGFRVTLIDDRSDFLVTTEFPSGIYLLKAERWVEAVSEAIGNGTGIYVAIVTRGHKEDEECLRAVITRQVDYVGMIGSKRRTKIVLDRLRDAGFSADRIAGVRAPIGLDIGAVTPEEVAISILAEIIATRRGGKGDPMSNRKSR